MKVFRGEQKIRLKRVLRHEVEKNNIFLGNRRNVNVDRFSKKLFLGCSTELPFAHMIRQHNISVGLFVNSTLTKTLLSLLKTTMYINVF